MKQPVKLEYEVHWTFNADKMLRDPMGRQLKSLGKQVPYRIRLNPSNELLSDRMFNLYDPYYIHEIHFLNLDHGNYSLSIEDLSGWLTLSLKNIKLNTVTIPKPAFVLS